jgi:hypothetical protein
MTIIQNEATAIIKSDFLSAEEKGKIGEFDLNVWLLARAEFCTNVIS